MIKSDELFTKLFIHILFSLTENMKSKDLKKDVSNFVFDDDTSDSDDEAQQAGSADVSDECSVCTESSPLEITTYYLTGCMCGK